VEEKEFTPPAGADMKTTALVWLLRQGSGTVFSVLFGMYFVYKSHQLEQRLDACQNAETSARIEEVVASNQAVINAIETLVGKLEYRPQPLIKTRIKQ